MQGQLEFTFSDLKCKLVINVTDGKILGHIVDIVFLPQNGKILGFLVPGAKKSFFKSCENIFIPYNCVCKVGLDVILVELFVDTKPSCPCPPKNKHSKIIGILNENDKDNINETQASLDEDYSQIEIIDPKIYPH